MPLSHSYLQQALVITNWVVGHNRLDISLRLSSLHSSHIVPNCNHKCYKQQSKHVYLIAKSRSLAANAIVADLNVSSIFPSNVSQLQNMQCINKLSISKIHCLTLLQFNRYLNVRMSDGVVFIIYIIWFVCEWMKNKFRQYYWISFITE